jgi:hypothetical protein
MANQKTQLSGKRLELIKEGEDLKRKISADFAHLFFGHHFGTEKTVRLSAELESEIRAWFNKVNEVVGSICLSGSQTLAELLTLVLHSFQNEEAIRQVDSVIAIIKASPNVEARPAFMAQPMQTTHVPNTAFILMWMDKTHAELDDVSNTIKQVCQSFGIRAIRADDVEHSDRITDLILDQIRSSEFLIADLSGERPNVYYEIGFAHALGKRPILYRKEGTKLHFDLSVHNVPEYKNITELKELLTKRFEALLGRSPKGIQAKQ